MTLDPNTPYLEYLGSKTLTATPTSVEIDLPVGRGYLGLILTLRHHNTVVDEYSYLNNCNIQRIALPLTTDTIFFTRFSLIKDGVTILEYSNTDIFLSPLVISNSYSQDFTRFISINSNYNASITIPMCVPYLMEKYLPSSICNSTMGSNSLKLVIEYTDYSFSEDPILDIYASSVSTNKDPNINYLYTHNIKINTPIDLSAETEPIKLYNELDGFSSNYDSNIYAIIGSVPSTKPNFPTKPYVSLKSQGIILSQPLLLNRYSTYISNSLFGGRYIGNYGPDTEMEEFINQQPSSSSTQVNIPFIFNLNTSKTISGGLKPVKIDDTKISFSGWSPNSSLGSASGISSPAYIQATVYQMRGITNV